MAIERLRFRGSNGDTKYLDLSKALSLQTRKLHRQKMTYTVLGGFFVDGNGKRININTAPNTWPVKRSINRGFSVWRKMIAKTLSESEGMQSGKWNDFKVYLNNAHGAGSTMNPVDASNLDLYATTPEWDYSTMTTEDPDSDPNNAPDQFEMHIVGPHASSGSGNDVNYGRVGLLQSWVDSRQTPDASEPNQTPAGTTDPLANLFDSGDVADDRMTIIEAEGDKPPYDIIKMFGNAQSAANSNNLQRQSVAQSTTQVAVAMVHGFQAICGLVQLHFPENPGSWELVLDVESNGVKF
jgi:hypothetical protein